jgi:transcriptional regulator with XRE-family HTH domain
MLTGPQCRAARGLLGWTVKELAEASGVSPRSIATLESSTSIPPQMTVGTIQKVQAALEAAGVEIIEISTRSNGGGLGVRLRR